MIIIIFIQWWEPFKHRKMQRLETMNEMTEIYLLYHMQMFTDWILDPEVRFMTGWSFIGVIAVYMAVYLFLLIRGTIINLRLKCKKAKYKLKVKKAMQKKQE